MAPCLLHKDAPGSWWATKPGIERRIRMYEGMLDGTYRQDGQKTQNKEKIAHAKKEIARLKKVLKGMSNGTKGSNL